MNQNYIGSNLSISFTPLPAELTQEYMANLEKYIHYEEIDLLLQASIIHAQFEMIHPFEDGNGRIGRLLIPLFFYYTELLPTPTFYMSAFFEHDRSLYLEKLSNISKNKDWIGWIIYFLEGIIAQSNVNTAKALNILKLYDELKNLSNGHIRSLFYIQILDFIFQHPIFSAKQVVEGCNVGIRTIYTVLNKMVEIGVLDVNSGAKTKTFTCSRLLNIVS